MKGAVPARQMRLGHSPTVFCQWPSANISQQSTVLTAFVVHWVGPRTVNNTYKWDRNRPRCTMTQSRV